MARFWALSFVVGMVGCSRQHDTAYPSHGTNVGRVDTTVQASADSQALAHDLRAGALAMHSALQTVSPQINTVFSPYALQTAMAMMALSAQGNTIADMQNAMRWSLPPAQLGPAFATLDTLIATPVSGNMNTTLNTATRMWVMQDFNLIPAYGDAVQAAFASSIAPVDFHQPEATRTIINDWVSDETRGLIPDLLPKYSLIGANVVQTAAIYFKSIWQQHLTADTAAQTPFYKADGSTSQVAMMRNQALYPYASDSNYTAVDVTYDNGAVALLFVMPTGDMNAFMQTWDANALEALQGDLQNTQVELAVPIFHATQQPDAKAMLETMGLSVSLTGDANFRIYDPNQSAPDSIHAIFEKATIAVDPHGTVAAAAAAVVGAAVSGEVMEPPQVVFTADHPFLYYLHDTATNAVLFTGIVGDPAE